MDIDIYLSRNKIIKDEIKLIETEDDHTVYGFQQRDARRR